LLLNKNVTGDDSTPTGNLHSISLSHIFFSFDDVMNSIALSMCFPLWCALYLSIYKCYPMPLNPNQVHSSLRVQIRFITLLNNCLHTWLTVRQNHNYSGSHPCDKLMYSSTWQQYMIHCLNFHSPVHVLIFALLSSGIMCRLFNDGSWVSQKYHARNTQILLRC
jgi:hypothetical protein